MGNYTNLFDWSGGIRGGTDNPLKFPVTALVDGENVEVSQGAIRTRPGCTVCSDGSLPSGEVRMLRQPRFPTNESAYLVAQIGPTPTSLVETIAPKTWVEEHPELATPAIPGRYEHTGVLCPSTGTILYFGGFIAIDEAPYFQAVNDLIEHDLVADTWTILTPSGIPPSARGSHIAIWDATNSRMIVNGGSALGTFAYSRASNAWTELSTTGADPAMTKHTGQIYDGSLWVYNGQGFYALNLSTLVWTEPSLTPTNSPPEGTTTTNVSEDVCSVLVGSLMYVYGGNDIEIASNSIRVIDLVALEIAYSANLFLDAATGITHHAVVKHGTTVVSVGGGNISPWDWEDFFLAGAFVGPVVSVTDGTNSPVNTQRWHHTAVMAGDALEIYGGFLPDGGIVYDDAYVTDASSFTAIAESGQTGTPEGFGSVAPADDGLWASPTHIPTTSAAFTQIATLGTTPGVMTTAVLNDRAVVTEGVADPPWVWGGAMDGTAAASDWLVPKAVLANQTGQTYYDVSPQVCDKDSATVADVGNMRSSGGLYICTDMPKVEAFYIEMGTANTTNLGEGSRTYTDTVTLTAVANFLQRDLKGTIDHWVDEGAAVGHFENSGNTPLTLGAGMACPLVETGLTVNFADTSPVITIITPDGEGAGEVTLSEDHANAAVVSIEGMTATALGLTVQPHSSGTATVWSAATDKASNYAGYSIRQIVKAADISAGGNTIQVTIEAGTSTYVDPVTHPAIYRAINGGYPNPSFHPPQLLIRAVSIVERSGSTADGTTTPTDITFPDPGTIGALSTLNGKHQIDALVGYVATGATASGAQMVSDVIPFSLDETKDYLVTIDLVSTAIASGSTAGGTYRAGFLNRKEVASGYYYKSGADGSLYPEEAGNQTVTGFTLASANILGLVKIDAGTADAIPATLFVAHTTDAAQVDLTFIEDFVGVTVTQTTPGASKVYHAVSLDARATWQVFKASAWLSIVRENAGVWQYKDSGAAWQNASEDAMLTALNQALAVVQNQMTKTELEAITSAQWTGTGGIVLRVTTSIDFAFGLKTDGSDTPTLHGYDVTHNDAGALGVASYKAGVWTDGDGWTDGTAVAGVPLAQTGIVEYDGTSAFVADYHVVDEVPGYWYRLLVNGTSATTTISRILYKAPCQPLSNIGDGQPDTPMGFVYVDTSTGFVGDYAVLVSDNTMSELSSALVPLATDDYLYVGYPLTFNEVELTPYVSNTVSSVMTAEYWDGEAWTALTITDGTAGSSGKAFSAKGKTSWTVPSDWRSRIILNSSLPRGYWIRFKVSAGLSSTTRISEVRIYSVPPAIAKHKLAVTVKDRIALLNRPDNSNQCDLSRPFEEYGFSGDASASGLVGTQDSIHCAVAAYDSLFVGKTETWHQLTSGFEFQGVEAARSVPINSQVIIKAPVLGSDDGTRTALYFLNRYGALASSGLQVDSTWASARTRDIGGTLPWWDGASLPRLDLEHLHLACGEYYPPRNWLVWSVPMITAVGQTEQVTNNRLIVYDCNINAWLPPFTVALASMTGAYHYSATGPQKLGSVGLYGGTYDGRVLRIFDGTTDTGTAIAGFAEMGWWDADSPELEKEINELFVYCEGTGPLTLTIETDFGQTETRVIADADRVAAVSPATFGRWNMKWRFAKFTFSWTGVYTLYGMALDLLPERDTFPGA